MGIIRSSQYWKIIGSQTLSHMPHQERGAFVTWLTHNGRALRAYKSCPIEAIILWEKSSEGQRFALTRVSEGL